jgi:hypothetical protein
VFSAGEGLKVVRVHARPVLAGVMQVNPSGDRTDEKLICHAMGALTTTTDHDGEHSVPQWVACALPGPALILAREFGVA